MHLTFVVLLNLSGCICLYEREICIEFKYRRKDYFKSLIYTPFNVSTVDYLDVILLKLGSKYTEYTAAEGESTKASLIVENTAF